MLGLKKPGQVNLLFSILANSADSTTVSFERSSAIFRTSAIERPNQLEECNATAPLPTAVYNCTPNTLISNPA
jgi:hypothetical protein